LELLFFYIFDKNAAAALNPSFLYIHFSTFLVSTLFLSNLDFRSDFPQGHTTYSPPAQQSKQTSHKFLLLFLLSSSAAEFSVVCLFVVLRPPILFARSPFQHHVAFSMQISSNPALTTEIQLVLSISLCF
jgi:hypothetical protein